MSSRPAPERDGHAYPLIYSHEREIAAEYRGPLYIWDIDNTYLITVYKKLRDLIRLHFESAEDKRPVPGAPALLRALRRDSEDRSRRHPLFFVSASPESMRQVLEKRMLIDELEHDGASFRNLWHETTRPHLRHIKDIYGYKLAALLLYRQSNPQGAQEILFGDDFEHDREVYVLYSRVCAGQIRGDELDAILDHRGVNEKDRGYLCGLAAELPEHDPVAHIFIRQARTTPRKPDTPPFDLEDRRAQLFSDYFEAAARLLAAGFLEPESVAKVHQAVCAELEDYDTDAAIAASKLEGAAPKAHAALKEILERCAAKQEEQEQVSESPGAESPQEQTAVTSPEATKPQKFLVTSALPYANGQLHFGHIAGAYLPADIFTRYSRLAGHEVIYICGTDEYGAAISLAAERAGRSPREQADIYNAHIQRFFGQIGIAFDNFSRTTSSFHPPRVQAFFSELEEKGLATPNDSERQFCPTCVRYLPDRYVVGECYLCGYEKARGDECPRCGEYLDEKQLINPRCRLYGHPTELRQTRHWLLRLDLLKPKLEEWLATKRDFWKSNVLSQVDGFLKELRPREITRDLDWGVPVPLDEVGPEKVLYVWFDAPIGYITATEEWAAKRGTPEAWKDWWQDPECKLIHFIGKDNITFHCVTWPAVLLGQDEPWLLPYNVPANEFYNLEGRKFNKSEGWTIDTDDFFSKYPADTIRWTIARNAPENRDSEFTWRDFQSRVNAELNDTFGNFVNRVLRGFVLTKFDAVVPAASLDEGDEAVLAKAAALHRGVGEQLASHRVRRASEQVLELGFLANKYLEDQAPWKSIKGDAAAQARCAACLNVGTRLIELLAVTLLPFIPESAERIWVAVGGLGVLKDQRWGVAGDRDDPAGRSIAPFDNIFTKISKKQIAAEVEALEASLKAKRDAEDSMSDVQANETAASEVVKPEAEAPAPETAVEEAESSWKPEISYDDFCKLDLRLAKVISAETVKKADRLLKLELDVGSEQRTVVSGIRQWYEPEQHVGRQVVYLANLKPRKLRGVVSHGMILAVTEGEAAVLLDAEKPCSPGSEVS